jgi:hypothetical protein
MGTPVQRIRNGLILREAVLKAEIVEGSLPVVAD